MQSGGYSPSLNRHKSAVTGGESIRDFRPKSAIMGRMPSATATALLLRQRSHTAMLGALPPDVYSARDIAAAAGVPETRVRALIARGEIRSIAAQVANATQVFLPSP